MSSVLNLTEAKAKFSEVVDRVSHGEEIIITRMGHPVARITRYEPAAANPAWGSSRAGFASPRTSTIGRRTSPAI
jgi:prevent-host-death family protein